MAPQITQLRQPLEAGLTALGLLLPAVGVDKILQYVQLLLKWNRAYNLTAIIEPQHIISEHILDSLTLAPWLIGQRSLDVGTGAGLPGIPLAILMPEHQWVLLDSVGKKIRFLRQAVMELALPNVQVVEARVEHWQPERCFDNVVTRAFGSLHDILAKTRHLVCPGGQWLAMKGVYPQAELEGISEPYEVHILQVPGLAKQRHLVSIRPSLAQES